MEDSGRFLARIPRGFRVMEDSGRFQARIPMFFCYFKRWLLPFLLFFKNYTTTHKNICREEISLTLWWSTLCSFRRSRSQISFTLIIDHSVIIKPTIFHTDKRIHIVKSMKYMLGVKEWLLLDRSLIPWVSVWVTSPWVECDLESLYMSMVRAVAKWRRGTVRKSSLSRQIKP